MEQCLKRLSAMEYPGRVIILGLDAFAANGVIVYAVTGRSPSSRARKLSLAGNRIWTRPTDEETMKTGNVDLLVYPALSLFRSIAVSNGRQTTDVETAWSPGLSAAETLQRAHQKWTYEPDAPNFTPRISGCAAPGSQAALAVIRRREDGSAERTVYPLAPKPGQGKLLSTYSGQNTDPLPSFRGEPLDVEIREKTASAMAEAVYAALKPEYRVAVACVFAAAGNMESCQTCIINRIEKEEHRHE